jgi:hypothetical protein
METALRSGWSAFKGLCEQTPDLLRNGMALAYTHDINNLLL